MKPIQTNDRIRVVSDSALHGLIGTVAKIHTEGRAGYSVDGLADFPLWFSLNEVERADSKETP